MRIALAFAIALVLAAAAAAQQSSHVFVLMLENRSDAAAMKYMPFLSSLANQYGDALQAYSPSHGSFNAYLELVAGSHPVNGTSDNGNCNGDNCAHPYIHDNLVRRLTAKHMTWRGYFQSMPAQGYMGYQDGAYVKRHNPFGYLSDVVNSTAQQMNMYPWGSNFAGDLASGNVANYTWLVPDLSHDGHDPGDNDQVALSNADQYLAQQLPALLSSRYFQPGGDGVLLVTFDESELYSDNSCSSTVSQGCGGHIFFAVIGPHIKRGFQTSTHYMQANMLRGTCDLLGVNSCPGDGAQSTGIGEFFGSHSAPVVVNIVAPYNNYPDAGPYTDLIGNAQSGSGPIVVYAVYVDGQLYKYAGGSPSMQMWVPTPMGRHKIGLNAWDNTGAVGAAEIWITRTY